jgi:hypothetical protein
MDDEKTGEPDLTVSVDDMLRIRDRVRRGLVAEFHETTIALRVRRKVGDLDMSRKLEAQLRRIKDMIRALEDPGE